MKRGFTLIEVLIAAAIASIVLGGVYQLFVAGARTFSKGSKSSDAMLSGLLALESLANDLAQIHAREATAEAPFSGLGPASERAPASLDAAAGPLGFQVALPGQPGTEEAPTADVAFGLVSAQASGVYRLQRNGTEIPGVNLKALTFEFFPISHRDSQGVQYLRTTLVATDPLGGEEFPLVRLTALPVPTSLALRKKRQADGKKPAVEKPEAP